MIKPDYSREGIELYCADALTALREMPDESVQCCVTSPPYWGLRDYGIDGQMGLEKSPDEYVAGMVEVFREVRRVLRNDGSLWLNLGSSYAGSWGNYGGQNRGNGKQRDIANGSQIDNKAYVGTELLKPPTAAFYGKNPTRSPLLWRGPACGNDGKEQSGSQVADHACLGSNGGYQGGTRNRRGRNSRNVQYCEPSEPQTLQTGHDSEHQDCAPELQHSSPPSVQESTMRQSCDQPVGVFSQEDAASVSQQEQVTSSLGALRYGNKSACTSGTTRMLRPLAVRTVGKESFFSACHSPNCNGIGRCGLCWASLTIPSLNIKPKDEINIPHLVAMALQADGWILRQTIIWHKPNPMPESVTDRPTKAHEYLFLMSKSAKYYYDAEAVKEAQQDCTTARYQYGWNGVDDDGSNGARTGSAYKKMKAGLTMGEAMGGNGYRNRRSVWTVATQPFSEAHFATFPPKLIEPCVLAGCPEKVCAVCGEPYQRIVEREFRQSGPIRNRGAQKQGDPMAKSMTMGDKGVIGSWDSKTVGWGSSCSCNANTTTGTVLDPFGGAGTTGLVALQLNRKAVLIELNPTYCEMIEKRLSPLVNQGDLFRQQNDA